MRIVVRIILVIFSPDFSWNLLCGSNFISLMRQKMNLNTSLFQRISHGSLFNINSPGPFSLEVINAVKKKRKLFQEQKKSNHLVLTNWVTPNHFTKTLFNTGI